MKCHQSNNVCIWLINTNHSQPLITIYFHIRHSFHFICKGLFCKHIFTKQYLSLTSSFKHFVHQSYYITILVLFLNKSLKASTFSNISRIMKGHQLGLIQFWFNQSLIHHWSWVIFYHSNSHISKWYIDYTPRLSDHRLLRKGKHSVCLHMKCISSCLHPVQKNCTTTSPVANLVTHMYTTILIPSLFLVPQKQHCFLKTHIVVNVNLGGNSFIVQVELCQNVTLRIYFVLVTSYCHTFNLHAVIYKLNKNCYRHSCINSTLTNVEEHHLS